ncbi:MAG: thiamine-phosphate kinase, partial [Pontixanthobacter sp.]
RLLAPIVTSMMDVSDGLLLDASRIAIASGVELSIRTADIPIATAEERRGDALRWGDDYQLLFTAPAECDLPLLAYRIGHVLSGEGGILLIDGEPADAKDELGYRH